MVYRLLRCAAACRYDCIEELVAEDGMAFDVGQCLSQLPKDLDRMCCSLAMRTGPPAAAAAAADPGALMATQAPASPPSSQLPAVRPAPVCHRPKTPPSATSAAAVVQP